MKRVSKVMIQGLYAETGRHGFWCQRLFSLAIALALASCGPTAPVGIIGSVEGFAGAVAADEPRAATIARDVLSAGGTAADAAVALYFAMAVTLPSSASLGGGGVCIVHDPENRVTEAIDFMPRPAAAGRVGIPSVARGMAALHARYGRLRWEQLLVSAENLARFGTPMSRALAREVATAGDALLADPSTRRVFTAEDGTLLDEGDPLKQPELASVLQQIRQKGAGELYSGVAARTLAQAAESIGAPLTIADLRASIPQWRETVQVPWGDNILHFAPPPASGGLAAAELFRILTEAGDFAAASAPERAHLFVEAAKRVFVDRERWMAPDGGAKEPPATVASGDRADALMATYDSNRATPVETLQPGLAGRPENPWAASFVVADHDGNAVACNVTMNELFGTARMAPGTGILLAPAPNARGAGAISLGPVIMSNTPNGGFYFAGAASGGGTAISALARVMVGVLDADESLDDAMRAPRVHHNGFPDIAFHEPGEDPAALAALAERGHRVEELGIIGRVEAIWCPDSLQGNESTCKVATDPRVDGLAVVLSE